MIAWTITGGARLLLKSPGGRLADELVQELRQEFANESRGWTVSLRWQGTENISGDWYEEDSLRGDYLRQVRELIDSDEETLLVNPLYREEEAHRQGMDPYVAELVTADESDEREQLLREVASLGAELLSGKNRA